MEDHMESKWWLRLWETLAPHLVRWLAGRLHDWLAHRKEEK